MTFQQNKLLHLLGAVIGFYGLAGAATPASPTALRAWPVSESGIQLAWTDNAADELSYEVYRLEGRSGIYELLVSGLPADTNAYTDTNLPPGTLYQYRVSARNADGISSSGFARAITDDQPFGLRSLSFQNGLGEYAGAYDIGIRESQPGAALQNSYVWIDNNGPGDDNQALLHFSGLFGNAPDRVPSGADIARAILRIYLGTNSNAQSYKTVSFHQMLVPWGLDSSWGSDALGGNGVQIDDIEAKAQYDVINVFGMPDYFYELDVTPSLRAWAAGESDYGWVIRSGWGDGYAYYTTHNVLTDRRPELIVTYDSDPGNAAPQVTGSVLPPDGVTGVHEPARLEVAADDPDGELLEAVFYGREKPTTEEEDFTVVLLPDTQFYTSEKNGGTRDIFYRQTEWIIENREALNIPFVLHLGDISESGDIKSGAPNGAEWLIAARALYKLRDPETTGLAEGIPYAVCVGNHDQEPIWRSSGTTDYFNLYFGENHFGGLSYYGDHFGDNNDNHYYLFSAGGYDFIVISLEYSDPARDPLDPALLEWADALLKQYPQRRGIIISHHMVNPGTPAMWSPYGEAMYEVLKDNPNLHLMFGGHVTGEGLRVNEFEGNTVYAMVQDYQGYPEGGSGYLRLLRFSPITNAIHFSTYSPWLDESLEEFGGALSLPYDLGTDIPPFVELGRVPQMPAGPIIAFSWDQLQPSTAYEWYVEVSDGRKQSRSETYNFQSAARTYSAWRQLYFADTDPLGDRGADPDVDGFDNFTEFLFASHPLTPGPVAVGISSFALLDGSTEITFERMTEPVLDWIYEQSPDLSTWALQPEPLVEVDDHADGTESVHLRFPGSGDSPRFFRIRVAEEN